MKMMAVPGPYSDETCGAYTNSNGKKSEYIIILSIQIL